MNDFRKHIGLFIRHYKIIFAIMGVTWGIFLAGIVISEIYGSGYGKLSAYTGLFTYMMSLEVLLPFASQFMVFPYAVGLGWTRREFLSISLLFNIILAIVLVTLLNIFVFIFGLPSFGLIMMETSPLLYELVYITIAIGITFIAHFIALVFYRYDIITGIAFVFLLLSPLMYFRYNIIDLLKWSQSGILMALIILLTIGIICSLGSFALIRRTEVRA